MVACPEGARVPVRMSQQDTDRDQAPTTPGPGPDVTSDPNLDDPRDEPAGQDDEGTSSDWSSEGGATQEGPATRSGPAADEDAADED